MGIQYLGRPMVKFSFQFVSPGGWRRERDSNPRYGFPYTRFPSVRLQPLGHPSGSSRHYSGAPGQDKFAARWRRSLPMGRAVDVGGRAPGRKAAHRKWERELARPIPRLDPC
jgi:hypothetical protein